MAKKSKRRRNQMPRLSPLDKLIYGFVMVLLCVLYFLLIFIPIKQRNVLAFRDESVLAATGDSVTLWLILPWFTFFMMTFIPWITFYENRQPIFGIRNFRYGPPAWPKVYPLFMKNKPRVYVSQRKREQRRGVAVFLIVLLLVSFLPLPIALFSRDVLRNDGTIVRYGGFNQITEEYPSRDFSQIKIEPFRYTVNKGKYTYWGVKMTFFTEEGKKFVFDNRAFPHQSQSDVPFWLTAMQNLTRRYNPDKIFYDGANDLELVIETQHLSPAGQEVLCLLFQS